MSHLGSMHPQAPEETNPHHSVQFWRVPHLDNLELLHGSYTTQSFPRHTHDEYILGVIVRGAEVLRHRDITQVAYTGNILIIPPGVWHANHARDETGYAYRTLYPSVHLMKRFATEITGTTQDAPLFGPVSVFEDSVLSHHLLRLHLVMEQNTNCLEQETCLLETMAYLLSRYSSVSVMSISPRRESRYITFVQNYLRENYATNISLADLGKLTGVSPFHLLRLFQEAIGVPPHEYQTHLRISQAKRLLRQGWSAGQVAAEVGFVDQSHLTRHFKRIVGLTPGQFSPHRKNVQDAVTILRL